MPYVRDFLPYSEGTFPYGGGDATVLLQYGTTKTQFGYRSGVSLPESPPDLPDVTHGPTSKHVLDGLDQSEVFFRVRKSRGWDEHDRTYTETHTSSPKYGSVSRLRKSASPGTSPTEQPRVLFVTKPPTFRVATWSDRDIKRAAEDLARSTVPDRPYLNVTRTLAELRDAPKLIALANYLPRTTSEYGGAYLNQVFGVQPTVGDMQRLAEVVHRIEPVVRAEVASAADIIHRTASRKLGDDSGTVASNTYSTFTPKHMGPAHAGVAVYGNVGGGDIRLNVGISWDEDYSLRAYGRYSRAVCQMHGSGRSISKKLQPLLGSGLSADVIYDLTPYSWLLNWVKNFGSVLSYQEALVGADVVAIAHGFTVRQIKRVGWTASWDENPYGSLYSIASQSAPTGVAHTRSDRRYAGLSPYSLTAGSWDSLSGSQWAILGALGLASAPGVPIVSKTSNRAYKRWARAKKKARTLKKAQSTPS